MVGISGLLLVVGTCLATTTTVVLEARSTSYVGSYVLSTMYLYFQYMHYATTSITYHYFYIYIRIHTVYIEYISNSLPTTLTSLIP